jgi:CopG family nickel-responsive transcriptional regulator
LIRVTILLKSVTMAVTRFGISIENELLEALDEFVVENEFSNRSQAIRQLINRNVFEPKWQCGNCVVGTLTIIYNPQKRELLSQIAQVQESFLAEILSVNKQVFSHEKWMEVLTVKGTAKQITALSDKMAAIKGIGYTKVTMTRFDK